MTTQTIQPDATAGIDTYVSEAALDTNYATTMYFYLFTSEGSRSHGLLKFELPAIPAGETVTEATLYLTVASTGITSATVYAHRIQAADDSWTEAGATWNHTSGTAHWAGDAASDGGTDAGCSVSGTDYSSTTMGSATFANTAGEQQAFALDLAQFATMLSENHGFFLRAGVSDPPITLASSDHPTAARRPKLVIESAVGTPTSWPVEAHGTATFGGTAEIDHFHRGVVGNGTMTVAGYAAEWISSPGDARFTQIGAQIDLSGEVPVNVTQAAVQMDVSGEVPVNVTQAGAQADMQRAAPANVTQAAVQADIKRDVPVRATQIGLQIDGAIGRSVTTTGCWEVHLYDRWDVYICQLENATGCAYIETMNDAGGGQFSIYANDPEVQAIGDPLTDNAALQRGNIVRMRYRNIDIGAWVVENVEVIIAAAGEVHDRMLRISGRGLMGLLDKAMVYPASLTDPKTSERTFSAVTKAGIFLTLWNEFVARGGGDLQPTFTATHDSAGAEWTDSVYLKYRAGQSLLDVMRQLSALGLDFVVRPDRRLECYNTLGSDLSTSIVMRKGSNMLECLRTVEGHDLANAVLAEGQNLIDEETDATSIGQYGRREVFLTVGNTAGSADLQGAAQVLLAATKDGITSVRCTVLPTPYYPFYHYAVGDTIQVYAVSEFAADYRILSISMREESGPCDLRVELGLNSIADEYIVRVDKALRSSLLGIPSTAAVSTNLAVSASNMGVSAGVGNAIPADTINDDMIDWGTGTNQVSAVDMPIADGGGYFATDNVEAALQTAGSVTASLAAGTATYLLTSGTRAGGTAQVQTFNNGLIVNESGADSDSRVEGDTEPYLIWVDASADAVYFGGTANAVKIAKGGELSLEGTATRWRDEKGQLSAAKVTSPSSKIVQDDAESAYYYKDTAGTADYVWLNIQMNHDRKHGANISPHLHWWQTGTAIPNWVIQYRYQKQGAAKTTSWSAVKWASHAASWSTGTLNQITDFTDLTPPGGDGLSDILQVRILRDVSDALGLFSAADAVSGNAYINDFDVHDEVDTIGSREEYTK